MIAIQMTRNFLLKSRSSIKQIARINLFSTMSALHSSVCHKRTYVCKTEIGKKTALFDFHVERKGKIIDFGGFLLPVQYADLGIGASHLHTRNSSSIFDVSHMLQTYLYGKDCITAFESICTADIKGLPHNSGSLTVFTNNSGCILDDLIVTKINENCLYVVSNAAMKEQDTVIMQEAVSHFKSMGKDVSIEFLTPNDWSLLAIQGPKSIAALQKLTPTVKLSELYFMTTIVTELAGVRECRITRCGYTGEDGFEISIPSEKVRHVAEALLSTKDGSVKLAGLAARDSLRLEAGLCLYGSDIDSGTSPVEAGLAWLIAKRRRNDANFPGASKINEQLKKGVQRRRVGIRSLSGPPARSGVEMYVNERSVGTITSGCPSPSLGGNVAMGYLKVDLKKPGTIIQLKIRDRLYEAEIVKMPFLPSKYFTKPKTN